MPSLDRIVFVRRQSPDWEALMRDHEAGAMVDPSRYRPPPDVPGFPEDTVGCIEVWNRTLSVNFFRCRHILKQISDQTVSLVHNSICITDDRLGELPDLVGGSRFLLFFFDDDDWFAPHTFERLAALDLDQCDIAVFPLPRLGDDIITFIRPAAGARIMVGSRVDLHVPVPDQQLWHLDQARPVGSFAQSAGPHARIRICGEIEYSRPLLRCADQRDEQDALLGQLPRSLAG